MTYFRMLDNGIYCHTHTLTWQEKCDQSLQIKCNFSPTQTEEKTRESNGGDGGGNEKKTILKIKTEISKTGENS